MTPPAPPVHDHHPPSCPFLLQQGRAPPPNHHLVQEIWYLLEAWPILGCSARWGMDKRLSKLGAAALIGAREDELQFSDSWRLGTRTPALDTADPFFPQLWYPLRMRSSPSCITACSCSGRRRRLPCARLRDPPLWMRAVRGEWRAGKRGEGRWKAEKRGADGGSADRVPEAVAGAREEEDPPAISPLF
jgi:hypothetical protein